MKNGYTVIIERDTNDDQEKHEVNNNYTQPLQPQTIIIKKGYV
jgi:hypothetical protein